LTFDPDCEFCAIARGNSPAEIVCQGEKWLAFFPLAPATPGHTLVIPRGHTSDLWSATEGDARELMSAVLRVGRAIREALEPEGLNLISSAGRAAEQTVPHLHLHVVPRWRDDGFGAIWPPNRSIPDRLERDAADRIRRAC
jgi:histidine triad (HIT) family protein